MIPTKRKRSSISDATPDSAIEVNPRSTGEWRGASPRLPRLAAETPLASVRLDLPEYVALQLKQKCVIEGGVKAYYILKALAKDGFEIKQEDIRLGRRRRRKRR